MIYNNITELLFTVKENNLFCTQKPFFNSVDNVIKYNFSFRLYLKIT